MTPLTERWQNVYNDGCISDVTHQSKEDADEGSKSPIRTRTHYLKTYWNEEGVIERVELIKIEK